jgi:hypothetical protein
MFLLLIPVFIYTAIHILATFTKLRTNEADGHLFRSLGGLFALYLLIGWSI